MSPEYGEKIADAFKDYLKTGDKSQIDAFSSKELRQAISRLSPYYDNNKQWYRVIEERIEELAAQEEDKRKNRSELAQKWKEQWLDKIIAFLLGVIAGILFFKKYLM